MASKIRAKFEVINSIINTELDRPLYKQDSNVLADFFAFTSINWLASRREIQRVVRQEPV